MDFPGGSFGKESPCNAGDQVWTLGLEDPWRRKWQLTPVILGEYFQYSCPPNSHRQKNLVGYSSWGCKEPDKYRLSQVSRNHLHLWSGMFDYCILVSESKPFNHISKNLSDTHTVFFLHWSSSFSSSKWAHKKPFMVSLFIFTLLFPCSSVKKKLLLLPACLNYLRILY